MFDLPRVRVADVYVELWLSDIFADEIRILLSEEADKRYAAELVKLEEDGFNVKAESGRRYVITWEFVAVEEAAEMISIGFEAKGLTVRRATVKSDPSSVNHFYIYTTPSIFKSARERDAK